MKSLVTVAQCRNREVREYANNINFWKDLLANARYDRSLITIIDFGMCKTIKDEG